MERIVFDIDPYTFTGSAVIIAFLLTKELSITEQDSIGNWLQLIGLVIQTYASQVATLESKKQEQEDTYHDEIKSLKKAIDKIQEYLRTIEKDVTK